MLVSIVVLCHDERVNDFDKKLRERLKKVDFDYEIIYVFQTHYVYLEQRPKNHAKFVCVKHFLQTRKETEKVYDAIEGEYVAILSPALTNSIYYMLEGLTFLKEKKYDMVTMMDGVLAHSFFTKLSYKIHQLIHYKKICYILKKDVIKAWLSKKNLTSMTSYYLPYEEISKKN